MNKRNIPPKVKLMSLSVEKLLSMPLAGRLLLAANLGSLLFVFVMQFGFDLKPCVLCLWERIPYYSTTVLLGLALVWKPCRWVTISLLGLCALIYLTGMGLAVFHTGVEQHWWLGTSGCAVNPLHGASPDDLREALLHTVAPRCDEIVWTVLGLSMTNLNIVWSLLLAFFSAAAAAKAVQDS